ncbi:hypothetical protein [Aureivirga marina]|uniref:hypothetical protein n=1 Tax=Aureivirga marina TaxID=1182451 RepID=UPI0018C9B91E|nr:hypothetical protein [Aureivirga marina]
MILLIGFYVFAKSFVETGIEIFTKDFNEIIIKQEFYNFSAIILIGIIYFLVITQNKNIVQKRALLGTQIAIKDIIELSIEKKVVEIKTNENKVILDKISKEGKNMFSKLKIDL